MDSLLQQQLIAFVRYNEGSILTNILQLSSYYSVWDKSKHCILLAWLVQ